MRYTLVPHRRSDPFDARGIMGLRKTSCSVLVGFWKTCCFSVIKVAYDVNFESGEP